MHAPEVVTQIMDDLRAIDNEKRRLLRQKNDTAPREIRKQFSARAGNAALPSNPIVTAMASDYVQAQG
jgi:hypothetical protein